MAKIAEKLRLGEKFEGDADKLEKLFDQTYNEIAPVINGKVDVVIRESTSPTTQDINHNMATLWLRRDTANLWILTDFDETVSPKTATWTVII